jgi:hypothetical protein
MRSIKEALKSLRRPTARITHSRRARRHGEMESSLSNRYWLLGHCDLIASANDDFPFMAIITDESGTVVSECPVRTKADGEGCSVSLRIMGLRLKRVGSDA